MSVSSLLTAVEVAQMLGVHKKWVYRHASTAADPLRPVVPAVDLGGTIRFRRESIERFIDEQERRG